MYGIGVLSGCMKGRKWSIGAIPKPFAQFMILDAAASFEDPPAPRRLVVSRGWHRKEMTDGHRDHIIRAGAIVTPNGDYQPKRAVLILQAKRPSGLALNATH